MVKKSAKFSASVKCHARPSSMWDTETSWLPLLDPKGEKKTATKGNRKVLWSSRQLSSLFPLESTFPCFRSSAARHPSSSSTMNPKADDRTIDPCARSIRRYARGELRQSSSTAHHNFRLARSIPPLKNHLLFANHSLRRSLPSPLPSPSSSSSSSPFTSLFVVLLYYFTLAHTLNFAYCCRRWRSLKTIITFVLFQRIRDGDDSPPRCS